ncbi:hypothetical protein DFH09DRAFT_1084884 [Mycena vulgaris]|nr:hypothetical protein DFH09DRAFT_1084884 [Mycena vulgaris]
MTALVVTKKPALSILRAAKSLARPAPSATTAGPSGVAKQRVTKKPVAVACTFLPPAEHTGVNPRPASASGINQHTLRRFKRTRARQAACRSQAQATGNNSSLRGAGKTARGTQRRRRRGDAACAAARGAGTLPRGFSGARAVLMRLGCEGGAQGSRRSARGGGGRQCVHADTRDEGRAGWMNAGCACGSSWARREDLGGWGAHTGGGGHGAEPHTSGCACLPALALAAARGSRWKGGARAIVILFEPPRPSECRRKPGLVGNTHRYLAFCSPDATIHDGTAAYARRGAQLVRRPLRRARKSVHKRRDTRIRGVCTNRTALFVHTVGRSTSRTGGDARGEAGRDVMRKAGARSGAEITTAGMNQVFGSGTSAGWKRLGKNAERAVSPRTNPTEREMKQRKTAAVRLRYVPYRLIDRYRWFPLAGDGVSALILGHFILQPKSSIPTGPSYPLGLSSPPKDIVHEIFLACLSPTSRNASMSTARAPLLLCRVCPSGKSYANSRPLVTWMSVHIPIGLTYSSGSVRTALQRLQQL